MRQPGHPLIALLAFAFLIGCTGVKTYPNRLPKNLHIRTQVNAGPALTNAGAEFDIHRVDAGCNTHYQGRVYLDKPLVEVGIPPGEPSYLDFIFASKAFLSTTTHAVRYQTVLTPRADYEYDIQASYVKGIYNVVIRERHRGSGASRLVERKSLNDCHARRP
ncbi:MAG: hypothetical protein M1283_03670 [Gammaproteobacteria bacterium]|nr:hypothetical protein [Gammaproteobacteria bacterium]